MTWWVIFLNSTKSRFNGELLNELHQIGESRGRFIVLVDQIHGGVGKAEIFGRNFRSKSVFGELKLMELYHRGPY